ncbi:MAG: deoxyribonuclease IV [Candidatus Promineifilaceae bacterium]|nr:deoxyribonuclease IV [Candidatus Promineifilaceae bacterium]
MRLGAHISVAGGLHNAFERGAEVGCDSIMIFTKSNRQWKATPLTEDDITLYREAEESHAGISPVSVHASYLINLASPDPELREKSYQALKIEVERADAIGAAFLVFHPGAYTQGDEESGLNNIAAALNRLLEETEGCETKICLETMAGTGTTLGHRFEHLAYLIEATGAHERIGVCFDTCHVFAAGYDIRSPEAYAATMEEFDRVVGLERICCFHFNDSRHELGSNKDRHQHIGEGHIGLDGFANFLNDLRFVDHPAHLETPKTEEDEEEGEIEMDPINLGRLRELLESAESP